MVKQRVIGFLLLAILVASLVILPAQAAERIYLSFGPLGRSIAVADLEQFAQTGKAEGTLAFLLNRFPNQRAQVQSALQSRYPVDPIMFNRFAYTSSGEKLLQEMGEVVQTEARQNGWLAMRSAVTLAAADPAGLSVLGFLQQFPTDIRIDLQRVLNLVQKVTQILRDTEATVVTLNQQTRKQVTTSFQLQNDSADIRKAGSFTYQKQTFQLFDETRNRKFAMDLYLPDAEGPLPLIVGSNGLGAGRDRFDEIAPHLASHGFAVAVPDHPGSDRQRLREFYAGLHRENFDATEYIDRPRDITFVLNELERLNPTLAHPVNTQRVGLFGYSFGGSTALSLAGAQIDFDHLQTACDTELGLVNISLLYQCRALELPRDPVDLQDERIQAAFLFVPFGKSLFGQSGMAAVKIPIFWQVTDLDILTPLAVEQIPAFAALTTPDRYLTVTEGLPHARVTYDVIGRFTRSTTPWETLKWIAQDYQNALSLAFFQVYVAEDETYRAFLQPNYAVAISQEPYRLSLVRDLTVSCDQLDCAIQSRRDN